MTGVITLGETMLVLSPPAIGPLRHAPSLDTGVAGAESNVAIGVRRLGVAATWIGRVGADEPGARITMSLRGEDVRTHAVIDDAAPTALMLKERRTADATRVTYYRAGNAGSRISPADIDPAWFAGHAVLHVSGITPALSSTAAAAVDAAIDHARAAGLAVSFDVNFRSRLWTPAAAARVCGAIAVRSDVLFVGDDEAHLLTDATGDALLPALGGLGPTEVLLKRGSRGAVALIDGERFEAPPHRVACVDPVGAGDAFAAGYLAARCRGLAAAARVAVAAATGAFAVTVRGDWEGAPTWDELDMVRSTDGHVVR